MKRLVLSLALVGCSAPDSTAREEAPSAPSGDTFRPVAEVLLERCGSLDCHGSKYRNLRLVGFGSGRLDPTHRPDAPGTTVDEVAWNYDAVVALEPEKLAAVLAEKGRAPERLTLYRKGIGAEAHKGGRPLAEGEAADRCLRAWLAGAVDRGACEEAVPRLR